MNREILFRAKKVDGGEWVEGYVVQRYGAWFIYDIKNADTCRQNSYLVYSDTICQYTGLTDKNGKRIFENDIVFVTDENGCTGQIDTGYGEIDFLKGLWYISGRVQNGLYDIYDVFEIEVVGNIFDNSEFLEE